MQQDSGTVFLIQECPDDDRRPAALELTALEITVSAASVMAEAVATLIPWYVLQKVILRQIIELCLKLVLTEKIQITGGERETTKKKQIEM